MEETRFIGEQRRKLGITQSELAKMAGVSQSLIAKIEGGRVDASYSKVKRIMETLERVTLGKEKMAQNIMHTGVESLSPSASLHKAAAEMRKRGISQMPVVDGGQIVGSISEQAILSGFSSGKRLGELSVRDMMEDAFPNVLPSTPISSLAPLLRHHSAVLVSDKGKIAGIITKADILKAV